MSKRSIQSLLTLAVCLGAMSEQIVSKYFRCAVCNALIKELDTEIKSVDPRKQVDLGYRLDSEGKQMSIKKPYAGSETHMIELLESICGDKLKDYVQAKHKETDDVVVIPLVVEGGKMNPKIGEYELLKDADLNKGVSFHCESVIEDFEDEIRNHFDESPTEEQNIAFCINNGICEAERDEL